QDVCNVEKNVRCGSVVARPASLEDAGTSWIYYVGVNVVAVPSRSAPAIGMHAGFIATGDDIIGNGVVVAAQFNTIENPRSENDIRIDHRVVCRRRWRGTSRDSELAITDRIARDGHAARCKNQNTSRSICRVIDGVGCPYV